MAESTPKSYSLDPTLYLYTSLTSGSSHIVTATSRLETILKANKIPFKALDIATDEKARMLWGRRAGKDETGRTRKIPGLVQMGLVVGDLVEIEDWNEYGELKQHVKIVHDTTPKNPGTPLPSTSLSRASLSNQNSPAAASESTKPASAEPLKTTTKEVEDAKETEDKNEKEIQKEGPVGGVPTAFTLALRQAGEEAAQKAKEAKNKVVEIFSGTGEAIDETPQKDEEEAVVDSTEKEDSTVTVPPTIEIHDDRPIEHRIFQNDTCMQSPTSTSWAPMVVNGPITMHRGSVVSEASAEEIKKIEEEETICEEDEEAVEE